MNTRVRWYIAALAIWSVFAAAAGPLDDYELLQPVTIMDAPDAAAGSSSAPDAAAIVHGKYLVELLGCGTCHTDGALAGMPRTDRRLAGSHIGIAYSDPLTQPLPGVVYPANLTPDMETGIGSWSEVDIVSVIRSGVDRTGRQHLSVMPWPAYAKLSDDDARAIAAYLRALPPVAHQVPENVPAGTRATAPFVHFGVYRSRRQD